VLPPKGWNRGRTGHELPDPNDSIASLPVLRLYEVGGHGPVGAELGSPRNVCVPGRGAVDAWREVLTRLEPMKLDGKDYCGGVMAHAGPKGKLR